MVLIPKKNFLDAEGIKKDLADIRKGIDAVKKSSIELQQATRAVNKEGSGAEAKKRIDLTRQLEAQSRKLIQAESEQNKQLQLLKVATQQANKEAKDLAKTELQLLKAHDKLSKETNEAQKYFKNLAVQFGINSKEAKKAKVAFDKLDNRLRSVNNAARDGRRDVGRYGTALKGVGSNLLGSLGVVGGMTALVSVFKSGVKIFKDFSKSASKLAAILGKNKDEIKELTDQAKLLGSTSAFTASEVIALQTELAKLGFSTQQIEASTEGILNLAAATGSDLASSAELAGATLRIFNLNASEMGRVTDVLAKSTTISSLSMEKLATILPTVGKTAQIAGVSLEKTAALAGTLTDRGLDASSAATSLRNIFLELSKKGLSWNEAMEQINTSTDKNKTAMDLFGKRAAAAGVILSETADDTDKLTTSLEDANGAAQEMADTMLDNLAGDMTKAQSAWEGFILSLEDGKGIISNVARTFTQAFTNMLEQLRMLNEGKSGITSLEKNFLKFGDKVNESWDKISKKVQETADKDLQLQEAMKLRGKLQLKLAINQKVLNKAQEDGASRMQLNVIQTRIDFTNELIKKTNQYIPALSSVTDETVENTTETNNNTSAIRRQIAAEKDLQKEKQRRAQHEDVAPIQSGLPSGEVSGGFDPVENAKETTIAVNEMIAEENEAFREDELERALSAEEAKQEGITNIRDTAISESIAFANDLVDQNTANRISNIEAEAEAEKKILEDQLAKGLITKEEFAAKSEEIDKKARADSAKAEKKAALFKIAINTAIGIVKALASAGPPVNFINAAAVAAAGAIQAAFVAARPAPAFKDGVIGFKGKGTSTSDSNDVKISNLESVITAKGTANAPLTLDAINKGLVTDSQLLGMTPKQSEGLQMSLLMSGVSKGNKINEQILTALLNGGGYAITRNGMIEERRMDGTNPKYPANS